MRSVGTALNKGVDAFGRPITAVTGIPTPQVSVPTTAGTGAGQADLARITANTTLQRQLAKIAANDRTVADAIRAAATGSAQGRQRLITALANARDDVTAIGPHTRTAPGRKALIDALTGRVSNGKTTLTSASADNRTQAARVANASYPTSRTGGSGFQMPQFQMPQIPTTGSGSGSGVSGLARPAQQLMSFSKKGTGTGSRVSRSTAQRSRTARATAASARTAGKVDGRKKIPTGSVEFKRIQFPKGKAAFRGYILRALDLHGITDPTARRNWLRGMETVAGRESTYNNLAVNKWDSNAVGQVLSDGARAKSSRGGLQFIPSTFASNHHPGTSRNIYDPVAQAAAFVNYARGTYGVSADGSNLAARIQQANPGRAAKGY
ncbi:DUF4226 domain-containing protein [Tsukamurella ocularis]|uniref:DUF4226 domain-containing protein n=1 Tax=Tsukamurella ocularis TaxID=1970234 RepID=UPI002167FF82|nr:DUF4226 domain-containing protein [Tsukamurella ocularis]MCS3853308.1 hypothetical protein [Tsukamurella ocularis]